MGGLLALLLCSDHVTEADSGDFVCGGWSVVSTVFWELLAQLVLSGETPIASLQLHLSASPSSSTFQTTNFQTSDRECA